MTKIQSSDLSMIALGSDGTDPHFYNGLVSAHLRWTIGKNMEWPTYGFELYRRTARNDNTTCLLVNSISLTTKPVMGSPDYKAVKLLQTDVNKLTTDLPAPFTSTLSYYYHDTDCKIGSSIALAISKWPRPTDPQALTSSAAGQLVIRYSTSVRQCTIEFLQKSGTVKLYAYDNDVLVATTENTTTNSRQSVQLTADRFNTVVAVFTGPIGVYSICRSTIPTSFTTSSVADQWTSLGHFNLPTSEAEITARVSNPEDIKGAAYYGGKWSKLSTIISGVGRGQQLYAESSTTTENPKPEFNADSKDLLLVLSSADVGMARALGLYYIHADNPSEPTIKRVEIGKAYDYAIVGRWTDATTNDAAWICYNVEIKRPSSLRIPKDLTVSQSSLPGGLLSSTGVAQTAAKLQWSLPTTTSGKLKPNSPAIYHVFRENWIAPSSSWGPARKLTAHRPFFVANSTDDDGLSYSPSAYYTDSNIADGRYQYSVCGVDLFGRETPHSASVAITIKDTTLPPAPINLKASIDNTTKDATVTWSWTTAQQVQASDARKFKVYYQIDNIAPIESYVTATSIGSTTSSLTTELDPTLSYSEYTDGYVIAQGKQYSIKNISTSTGTTVVEVYNQTDSSNRTVTPAAYEIPLVKDSLKTIPEPYKQKGRMLLMVNWSNNSHWKSSPVSVLVTDITSTGDNGESNYSTTLPELPLTLTPSEPIGKVLFSVCTEDADGNTGKMCQPFLGYCALSQTPPTPGGLLSDDSTSDDGVIWAKRADYFGKSKVNFSFDAGTDDFASYYFEILRASDTTLQLAKTKNSTGSQELSDDIVLSYADQLTSDGKDLEYRKAFVNLNARNDDGTLLTASSRTVNYTDEVPGTGNARYVYKIQAYDKAGNRSFLSNANQIVKLIDVTPPSIPILQKVLGGDRSITLEWSPVNKATSYRLYRTSDEGRTRDIRTMDLVVEQSESSYTDSSITALTTYYYRLVAVNAAGIVSYATKTLSAKAFDSSIPDAVTLSDTSGWALQDSDGTLYDISTDTSTLSDPQEIINLEWTPTETGQTFLLQKQTNGLGSWQTMQDWTDELSYTDTDVVTSNTHKYRLKTKSASGIISLQVSELTFEGESDE